MKNIKTLDSYFEGFGEYAELLKSFKFEGEVNYVEVKISQKLGNIVMQVQKFM